MKKEEFLNKNPEGKIKDLPENMRSYLESIFSETAKIVKEKRKKDG